MSAVLKKWSVIFALSGVSSCGAQTGNNGGLTSWLCSRDKDCSSELVCVSQRCVEPGLSSEAGAPSSSPGIAPSASVEEPAPEPVCPAGEFRLSDANPKCALWTVCASGEFVRAAGTDLLDRECGPCGEGSYSDVENATECSNCGWTNEQAPALESKPSCALDFAIQHFGGPFDVPFALAALSDGSVYVTGYTAAGVDETRQAFLRKFSADGNELWSKRLAENESYSAAVEVILDPAGGLYVSGIKPGATFEDEDLPLVGGFIGKFDDEGEALWMREFPFNEVQGISGLALDEDGNVYFASDGFGDAAQNAVLGKLNSRGDVLWVKQLGENGEGLGSHLALDGSGSLYFAGQTDIDVQSDAPGVDGFLSKYTENGEEIWSRRLGAGYLDTIDGLVADENGVYAAVTHISSLDDDSFAYASRFDADGEEVWKTRFESQTGSEGIAVDELGLYLVYTVASAPLGASQGNGDYVLVKLTPDGVVTSTRQLGEQDDDYAHDVATDAEGNVYITGYTSLLSDKREPMVRGFLAKWRAQ